MGQRFCLESLAQLFGRDNLRLWGLVVVNRVRQGFAIIQDRNLLLALETNQDLGIAQGIRGALGLDLVDGLVKLESKVFGEGAGFLPGENASQILFGGEWAVQIHSASGIFAKAGVEILEELRQISIALGQGGNPP